MRYSIPLAANAETRLAYRGRVLEIVSCGALAGVTVAVEWADNEREEAFGRVPSGFKVGPGREFSAISITATAAVTVDLVVSDVDVEMPEAAADAAATTSYPGTVAVTDVGQLLMAANTAARRVVIANHGPDPVGISRGAAARAKADCAIVLEAGAAYIEDRFAGTNEAWRARCAAGLTASVAVEVKS